MQVPTTVDYSRRLVDLELLQSVVTPSQDPQRVYPTFTRRSDDTYTVPKIVTGIEKAIQRYANLLLLDIGSKKFFSNQGGELVKRTFNGTISSKSVLEHLFAIASDNAITTMAADDHDSTFGRQPKDEKIVTATLADSYIDYAKMTISLKINMTFSSGNTYTYVIPVQSGVQ